MRAIRLAAVVLAAMGAGVRGGELPPQVSEGIIEAPVGSVWKALTTKEGLEAWNVAHAEVDLRVGGALRSHYDPKGVLGDKNTIVNSILSYEPERMLSIRIAGHPEKFPFPNACKSQWTVIHFEPMGPDRTKLRLVGLGYESGDESRKMHEFFQKGNDYTIGKLQEHFAKAGSEAK